MRQVKQTNQTKQTWQLRRAWPTWSTSQRLRAGAVWLLGWRFLELVLPPRLVSSTGYVAALAGVALVSAAIGAVLSPARIGTAPMLYLLVVLPTAVRFGRGPAIFASVVAFLTYNWFFIEPIHTFTIAEPAEWVALLLFLLVSVVTSHLAAAQRARADEARLREREARALYELGRILHAHDDLDAALAAAAEHLRAELSAAGCAILLPSDPARGGPSVPRATAGTAVAAAEWVVSPAKAAAIQDGTPAALAGGRWVRIRHPARPQMRGEQQRLSFVPLLAGERRIGTLRIAADPRRPAWAAEETRLIDAAAGLIALAIERARLRQEATAAEVLRKTDQARSALLASVSHDLRTPLASVKATIGSLLQSGVRWSDEERRSFLMAMDREVDYLTRLVEHLLDMSRIEAGTIRPEREWYPLDALVNDVLGRLRGLTAGHPVAVDVPDTLPPIFLDYVHIGAVLANLVENAVRYTPPATQIRIVAHLDGDDVRVAVTDDGPGIAAEALPHVFEKFYRVAGGDTARVKGTGLGLAVARGLVEVHGGRMEAHSPPLGQARGTGFVFTLPLRPPGAPALPPLERDGDEQPSDEQPSDEHRATGAWAAPAAERPEAAGCAPGEAA